MRTKKAVKNMMASLLYQVVAIICGLITPRLILGAFGSTYNGVVMSATQFLNMINILTLGITASTRVALYKPLSQRDYYAISCIMKATKKYMRKIAVGVIVYVGILCLIYPLISHNDLTHLQNALLIAIVGIGVFAEYFFGLSSQTLLQADQASYIIYGANIGKSIINTISVAFLISQHASIYTVKLGSSIIFFVLPALLNIYINRKYCLTKHCQEDSTAIKQRGAVAFHSISNIIHDNADLTILTLFADAKLISVYTVYYLAVGKVKALLQVLTSGMEAAFGNMWVNHEIEALNKNFKAFEYMIFSFTAIVFSCVIVLLVPFVELYTVGVNDINYVRPVLGVLISVTEIMYCIRQPYLTLVYATGSFEQTKWGAMLEALLNIVISLLLVNYIGINGVIIGTLIANTFRTVQFSVYISKNILHSSIISAAKKVVWMLLCILISVLIVQMTSNILGGYSNWIAWIEHAIVCFGVSCAIVGMMSLIFYKEDMQHLLGKAKSLMKRRNKP